MRQLHLEHLEVVEHRRSSQLHFVPVDACAAPRGLLSLSSIVFILPWFNDASIASDAAYLFWLAINSLTRRDTVCRALAMLAAYSFAVVRVVSILIGLRQASLCEAMAAASHPCGP